MKKQDRQCELRTSPGSAKNSGAVKLQERPHADVKSPNWKGPLSALTVDDLLHRLGACWSEMRKLVDDAGKLICEIIDRGEGPAIRQKYPDISQKTIDKLERVGRGKLLAQLALDNSMGAMCLSKMPVAVQKEWVDKPIPVVLPTGEIGHKPLKELSIRECGKVFAIEEKKVLSVEEQKAKKTMVESPQPPYTFDPIKGTVKFHEESVFNLLQLEIVISDLRNATMQELQKNASALVMSK